MTLTQLCFLALTALFSVNLERFRKPGYEGLGAPALHLLIIATLFLTAYGLTRRFYFALLAALCAQLVVLIVNNAKYRFLREALVFADLALYSQAIRFPRLYLPFIGVVPAVLGSVAIGASISTATLYEAPSSLFAASAWLDSLSALALAALLIALIARLAARHSVTLDANRDTARYGLLPTLAIYGSQAREAPELEPQSFPALETRPNLIAVQSESFFDARRLDDRIRPEVLQHFDRICGQSQAHGKLQVPAWGAYTMRSEFAFLTGQANSGLGFGRFDPLRYFQRRVASSGVGSFAASLKQQGYRCICIHPYPVEFFARHRIYPELGFDEFIDIRSFSGNDRFGPYTSDSAVCERIINELSQSTQPLFIFAITMENHGPLHLESIEPAERNAFFDAPTPDADNNLAIYLRHLKNADCMLDRLTRHLAEQDPTAILAWYGDHVPGMPDIYQSRNYADACTDYLVWSAASAGLTPSKPNETSVETLPGLMLDATFASTS
ncbi:LTA synthase family protein [Marinobacterium rhizophilum]|uniref:LTA synthase family protein n=1 Tax=Marinobacterium rhizophilum TaxID=420402 RepID=UPI000372BF4C|nr:LTA synthase family protein [Marinobacterium rhizophilum]